LKLRVRFDIMDVRLGVGCDIRRLLCFTLYTIRDAVD
jgi:hypothetical protein